MQVIQKSSSGTQSFPLDAMLLAQRTVFLTGEINTSTGLCPACTPYTPSPVGRVRLSQ